MLVADVCAGLLQQAGSGGGHGGDAGAEGGFRERLEVAGVHAGKFGAGSVGGGELDGVHGSKTEVDDGDGLGIAFGGVGEAEDADVFRAHGAVDIDDVAGTEGGDKGGADLGGERGVVELDGGRLVFEDGDFGGLAWRESGGEGEAGGHGLQTGEDSLAGLVGEGAGGEFELHLV